MNVPIGYLPYLAHPDWTVRRRAASTPTLVVNSDLGFVASIPISRSSMIRETSNSHLCFQHRGKAVRTVTGRNGQIGSRCEHRHGGCRNLQETPRECRLNRRFLWRRIGDGWDMNARLRIDAGYVHAALQIRWGYQAAIKVVAERLKPNRYSASRHLTFKG